VNERDGFSPAATAGQVKRRFRQYRFARQQRLGEGPGDFGCPPMVIPSVAESHQEAGIGNRPHLREKPFRFERSGGPSTAPASRMNERFSALLAFSNCSRTI
jgi:hypothetical protein